MRKSLIFNQGIRILLSTNSLILLAGAMLGPIYALFVEKIGGDLLDASITFAVYATAAGVVTFISGKYADRVKEEELVLVLGYLIMSLGFFSYALVQSMWALLIVQVVIGLGEAIYLPAYDVLYSKHLDCGKPGREWGAWEAMNYFITALGAIGGGALAVEFGFNAMFVAMGLLCFCSAIYIFRLPRRIL
jgi:MFS family permease